MAISNALGASISGAETAANLRTFLAANAAAGVASNAYFRFLQNLTITNGGTLTAEDGSSYNFEGTAQPVINSGGTLDMGSYSTLRLTGTSKQHTKIEGAMKARYLTYIADCPTSGSGDRNDFFSGASTMSGESWTIIMRGGQTAYLHLHGSAGINGLTILNQKISGSTAMIEFNADTYKRVSIPAVPTGVAQNIYLPRMAAGDGILIEPYFAQTSGTILISRGDNNNGRAVLIDPSYAMTGVPSIQRTNLAGTVSTTTALLEYFTLRADNFANQAVGVNAAVWNNTSGTQDMNAEFKTANAYSHPDGYTAIRMLNRQLNNSTVNNTRSNFNVLLRRADLMEKKWASISGAKIVDTSAPVVDTSFTGTVVAAGALTGIAFTVAADKTSVSVAITGAVSTQDIYNYWKWWTSQPAQMTGAAPVSQSLMSISGGVLNITGSITTSAAVTGAGNATVGITTTSTAAVTGSSAYQGLYVNDSAGGTKLIQGVADTLVEIKDDTGAVIRAFAAATGDIYHRTTTGRTYTIKVRSMGYAAYTGTYNATSGTFTPALERDKVLWPLDSTKTTAQLRSDADALTGYVLAANGDLTFPAAGTLRDAYLAFSRAAEQDLTKTTPAYNGATLTGAGNAAMTTGGLAGSGSLVLAGTFTGDVGTVPIKDSLGCRVVVTSADASSFNCFAIFNFGLAGEVEISSEGKSRHVFVVPTGNTLRLAYGAQNKITGYKEVVDGIVEPQSFEVALSIDSNVDSLLDLTEFKTKVTLDSVDTATNTLKIRVGAAEIDAGVGRAGYAYLASQAQALRLAARLGRADVITTISNGNRFGTESVSIVGAASNGVSDISEIATFLSAPNGFVINPKSDGSGGSAPAGYQVIIQKCPPVIAQILTEQLMSVAASAVTAIERGDGMLSKVATTDQLNRAAAMVASTVS